MTSEEDILYTKLSVEDRCAHKSWKARINGYEEAITLFGHLHEKASEWNAFVELVKTFVVDSNAIAQEKGLEATLVFVKNSAIAGRTAEDVMAGLISKCYGAPKAKTKDIALEITLMFIEIEKQNVVIEQLVKGMDHKSPKIVSTCIVISTRAINEFGPKVLNIKPLLKKLQTILEDRNKNVRDEAKLLVIEIYSWVGFRLVKDYLTNLKPLQIQELEAEFEKLSGDKQQPTRFLRSQKEQAANMDDEMIANGVGMMDKSIDEPEESEENFYSVNILSQLNNEFYEKLESKKWQERKETIDMLQEILVKSPKLESGDYEDLVRALKKIIAKDSNIVIVGVTIKCITMLANGLKKQFVNYASSFIPVLLEKFKEKKQNVVLPLREAVDAIYSNMTFESIHEDILRALKNKNPSVRAESVSFLTRCFAKCKPINLNKKMLNIFATALIKTLNEPDSIVRDNSVKALGTAWKVVSEKNIIPFLTNVDAIKFAKIKEAAENAITINTNLENAKTLKPKSVSNNVEKKMTLIDKNTNVNKNQNAVNVPSKTSPSSKVEKHTNASAGSSESLKIVSDNEKLDFEHNVGEVVQKVDITPKITDELIKEFSDRDWKIRSDALTKLQNIIAEAKLITGELGRAKEALQERISDSNVRIGANAIDLLESITVAMGSSFKNYIQFYLPGLLTALGDPKAFKRKSARRCINTWVDVCGYQEFFGNDILLDALKNHSVTLRSELWTWLGEVLLHCPPKTIPVNELKCLLPVLYANLEDKNASVRNNAEMAVLGFMMNLGYVPMLDACKKLKPMSVKLCTAKLDKEKLNLPPSPIERLKVSKHNKVAGSKSKGVKCTPEVTSKVNKKNDMLCVNSTTEKKKEEKENKLLFQKNNLKHQRDVDEHKSKFLKWNFTSPREEFIEQLREQMLTAGVDKSLISYMFHSEFKYHLEAISILSEDLINTRDDNHLALINNVDLILKWITLRFFDTNPSVLLKGLEYLRLTFDILIAEKYILHETEASSFVPYLITKLGDSKDSVRNNVQVILKQIAFIYSISKLFHFIMNGVKSKNSRQRSECLEHLTSMIEDYGTSICQPSVAVVFKEITKSIGDRDNVVRTAALNCCVAAYFVHGDVFFKFISHISEKEMDLLSKRLKRASKNRVRTVATFQPTMKTVVSSPQRVPDVETGIVNDGVFDSNNEDNEKELDSLLSSISQESIEGSPNNSNSESSVLNAKKVIGADAEHSSAFSSGVSNQTPSTGRFKLDETFMENLDAEVIKKPELLNLMSYNWPIDNVEMDFKQQERSKLLCDNKLPTKQCLRVRPFRPTESITKHPTVAVSINFIEELMNMMQSQNSIISNAAQIKLCQILSESTPNMRSMLTGSKKVLSLFYIVTNQFDNLLKSHDTNIISYNKLLKLCFVLCKYNEFLMTLNEQVMKDLLSKLLFLLSISGRENYQAFGETVNNIIITILKRSSHTLTTCTLMAMLYDTVKCPEDSSTYYKELTMKCLWMIIRDFPQWGHKLCYDSVLIQINNFFKTFDSRYWKNQPSDIPLRTYRTFVRMLVKIHRDKVLKALENPELSEDSEMVTYIFRVIHVKL